MLLFQFLSTFLPHRYFPPNSSIFCFSFSTIFYHHSANLNNLNFSYRDVQLKRRKDGNPFMDDDALEQQLTQEWKDEDLSELVEKEEKVTSTCFSHVY